MLNFCPAGHMAKPFSISDRDRGNFTGYAGTPENSGDSHTRMYKPDLFLSECPGGYCPDPGLE